MASNIEIITIDNVVSATSNDNVIKVQSTKSIVNVHNADGVDGKSAYAYAVEGGYQGTEEDFIQYMNENIGGLEVLLDRYDENIALQLQTIIG